MVVDAGQDPGYVCPSLIDAERFARIDLGVRIELPWELIRDHAKETEAQFGKGPVRADFLAQGPHAAFGHIYYDDGTRGLLLYVKSSLTGDENDYVLDYKWRYPAFPHESTGDQFFGEEQFEAYRALGSIPCAVCSSPRRPTPQAAHQSSARGCRAPSLRAFKRC